MDVWAEAVSERAELRELLGTLSDIEWERASLCEGWTVRDVAAHVIGYEGTSTAAVLRGLPAARFSPDRLNERLVRAQDDAGSAGVLERFDRYPEPTGLTASMGGAVALVDGLIHHQDIRRPLGRVRTIGPERLRFALSFARFAPPIRGSWTVRGVRVVATDLDWTHGRGPEARGTGEAVLLALAGRRGVASELTGPGAGRLQARLG